MKFTSINSWYLLQLIHENHIVTVMTNKLWTICIDTSVMVQLFINYKFLVKLLLAAIPDPGIVVV